jgi:Flp pilus assembly pilin Flp
MKKLTLSTHPKKIFGQGMTEYIIIVALVAVAAIGAFKMFGQTAQHQIAGLATELGGTNATESITAAQGSATSAREQADLNRAMGTFNGGNNATRN